MSLYCFVYDTFVKKKCSERKRKTLHFTHFVHFAHREGAGEGERAKS